jgi:hypothetical protein
MESTRILAAPGIRPAAFPGWRARLAFAFAAVVDRPSLWLFGVLGFCLRGGIVLLTLPIIVLPTPVEARLLLGDYLGTSGFSQRFWVEAGLVAFVVTAITLTMLAVLAELEIASFSRLPFVEDEAPAFLGRTAFLPVLSVQALSFIAVLLAAVPLIRAAIETTYAEIVRPTSSASIYERVIASLGQELFLLVIAIALIELLSALTTREVLARRMRASRSGTDDPWVLPRALGAAIGRLVRSPVRIIGTAVFGWIVTIALVALGLVAVALAWAGTRGAFLASVSLADFGDDLGMALMALVLAVAFVGGLALGGFASALRAAKWSVDRLR